MEHFHPSSVDVENVSSMHFWRVSSGFTSNKFALLTASAKENSLGFFSNSCFKASLFIFIFNCC